MDEQYISEQDNTITINTLAVPPFETLQTRSYLNGRLSIEEVPLSGSKINNPPYSTSRVIYRIKANRSLGDGEITEKDFTIRLICRNDEYFYSIQEEYLKMLDEGKFEERDALGAVVPPMELLPHHVEGKTQSAKLTEGKMRRLLKRPQVLEQMADWAGTDNSFYIVLNRLKETLVTENNDGAKFMVFNEAGFQELPNGEMPDLPGSEPHKIAIIVHGLASRIGEAYNDLAQHLERAGYHVFGFDYLTVNQPIADNARQLADYIKQLKKNYPKSELLVVAHSMGGLVARSAEVTHGAEIDQLIMAGTPNNGSILLSNQHLVRSLFLFASVLKIIPIKLEDYRQLVISNEWRGLADLTNKSAFIDDLNARDRLHYSKKYFSLVGKFQGLPHDLLVHNDNMTKINETNMPSIPLDKHHFEYFRGMGWYEPLDQALLYLK